MKQPPQITCPKCKGTGKVPLNRELTETLAALRAIKCGSAKDIFKRLKDPYISETAINNRLEDLRAAGLVTRERQGKYFRYQVC